MTSMKPEVAKPLAIAAFCLIAHIPFAAGTTYYVSSSQGSDSNSGINSSAPWQTISNVVKHASSLKPGDSLLFKAGDVFDGPLYISVLYPATAANPITIDRYGTGANPIILGDHESTTWTATAGYSGIYQTPSLGPSWAINVSKVYDVNGNKYVAMGGTNLSALTNGSWLSTNSVVLVKTLDGGAPPLMRLMEFYCINTPAYYIVQNIEACYGGKGIGVGNSNIVRNCYFHDCWAAGIGLYQVWGCQIYSNTITRAASTELYLYKGGNHWLHHNTISYTGTDLTNTATIIAGNCVVPNTENANIGLQQGTNNLVEYNSCSYACSDFFDWWLECNAEVRYNYGFHGGMVAAIDGTGIKFHHNVFDQDNCFGRGIIASHDYSMPNSLAPDTGPVLVYNNTVYNFRNVGLSSQTNAIIWVGVLSSTNAANLSYQSGPNVFNSVVDTNIAYTNIMAIIKVENLAATWGYRSGVVWTNGVDYVTAITNGIGTVLLTANSAIPNGSTQAVVFAVPQQVYYFNNLLVTSYTNFYFVEFAQTVAGSVLDYNLYYSSTSGFPQRWYWNANYTNSFAAWQAFSGQDAHSIYANPQFVSPSPITAADFRLEPTSPCIDAGLNLKLAGLLAPAAQYQDYLGTLIPRGTSPDIGAYEKIPLLDPPTNLHTIPQ